MKKKFEKTKKLMKQMPYDELIEEHKELIKHIPKDDPEYKEQKGELSEYKEERAEKRGYAMGGPIYNYGGFPGGMREGFADGGQVPSNLVDPANEAQSQALQKIMAPQPELSPDEFTKPGESIPRDAGMGDFVKYNLAHVKQPTQDELMNMAAMSGGIAPIGKAIPAMIKTATQTIQQPHYIFTAANPKVAPRLRMDNGEVVNFLKSMGENVEHVQGKYGNPESSILVKNPKNLPALNRLTKDLGQESGLWSNGPEHQLRYVNGPQEGQMIKGRGTQWHSQIPEDNYTTYQGQHFTHNLDFNQPIPSEDLQTFMKANESGIASLPPTQQQAMKDTLERLSGTVNTYGGKVPPPQLQIDEGNYIHNLLRKGRQ